MSTTKIIIAGGGPAGLTASLELAKKAYEVELFERENFFGGISRTAEYKGNRIDIGGHRFFSKSDVVMAYWADVLPLESDTVSPKNTDLVMLERSRLSRILWMRKLFDYPLSFSAKTFLKLGIFRSFLMGLSYMKAMILPIKPEKNLEDFFINRFGKKLYKQFFKDYTEKVWGVPCTEISASWGAQRIKGISIRKAILHALKPKNKSKDISQKDVETSLIDKFLYPKFGPGQMWEAVAAKAQQNGANLSLNEELEKVYIEGNKVVSVDIKNEQGLLKNKPCTHFLSTMPIKELVAKIADKNMPSEVRQVANNLLYRDFITVGLLCNKIDIKSDKIENNITKDNWIYIQESDVKVGRLQIFNNWSPYLVKDKTKAWIGLEYFCQEGDEFWSLSDEEIIKIAKKEMQNCNVLIQENVVDAVVIKTKKAYPAYFGSYDKFGIIREYLDKIENLYCIGRNGQHRYNNMDHSMLSALEAVKNIVENNARKDNIWNVNSEEEYHESK